jgi:hypothetical protein
MGEDAPWLPPCSQRVTPGVRRYRYAVAATMLKARAETARPRKRWRDSRCAGMNRGWGVFSMGRDVPGASPYRSGVKAGKP